MGKQGIKEVGSQNFAKCIRGKPRLHSNLAMKSESLLKFIL